MTDLDLYWAIQAFAKILNDADLAHLNYINTMSTAGALTETEWHSLHDRWEDVHVPAYYAYNPRRESVATGGVR